MTPDRVIHLDDVRDVPAPARNVADGAADHSWRPLNLIQLAANPPEPPTIGGLLYPAKRTVLSGETESMKTWFALILCKAELDIGRPVCWIDLDAMGPGAMLQRLQKLGVNHTTIADGFHYIEPNEQLDPAKQTDLTTLVENEGIRLCIIDAFNPILNLHQLDPNNVSDVETFWRTIADPIAQAGAAPVLLDHVVKNPDNRGKYATGSERKASGAIVHLGFKLLEPLRQGGIGRSLLSVHKDRPGYLPRPALGRLILDDTADALSYRIEPDKSHDQEGGFRPTALMEKISRQLERETQPLSTKQIEDIKLGKTEYVRKALNELTEDGYLTRKNGPRGALLYTTTRPYREADQPTPATSSRPRPDLVPKLTSTTSSLVPLPRGDEDVVARRPRDDLDLVPHPGDPIPEYDFPPIDETLQPYDDEPDPDPDIPLR